MVIEEPDPSTYKTSAGKEVNMDHLLKDLGQDFLLLELVELFLQILQADHKGLEL